MPTRTVHLPCRIGLCTAFALIAAIAAFRPADDALAQGAAPPAPGVSVASPLKRRVTQWDEYTGRFEPREQVEVRPRVSGFIDQIHFKDGAIVNKGDLLFTIDRRPYVLASDAAVAEVARAKAQVSLADSDLDRAEGLTRNQTITARDLDTRRSSLSVARASQQAAEANVKVAQLNLEWTQVRAPIAGRISDKRTDVGNLVAGGTSGTTLLTTIVSLDPIHFAFDASEADFIRYARLSGQMAKTSGRDGNQQVQVRLSDETEWTRSGQMNFLDNQLNARSGTIRGRAVFDNKDQFLIPGTFGRLRLFAGEIDALLIPDAAIVSDQTRKIVLTVDADNMVVPKPVVLGQVEAGLRVVRSGLAEGDRVIISGLANPFVRPGAKVTPQPGEIKTAAN